MAESEEKVTLDVPGKPSPAPEDRPNHDQFELTDFKLIHGRMMDITLFEKYLIGFIGNIHCKIFWNNKKNAIKIVLEEICLDCFRQLQGTELITVQLI